MEFIIRILINEVLTGIFTFQANADTTIVCELVGAYAKTYLAEGREAANREQEGREKVKPRKPRGPQPAQQQGPAV